MHHENMKPSLAEAVVSVRLKQSRVSCTIQKRFLSQSGTAAEM